MIFGIAGIQFIFQGKFIHFTAILKAHYSFTLCYQRLYKKRGIFNRHTMVLYCLPILC
jgi:hypothetical protein